MCRVSGTMTIGIGIRDGMGNGNLNGRSHFGSQRLCCGKVKMGLLRKVEMLH